MKFGQGMGVDDPNDDIEGQGHSSKVKVIVCHRLESSILIGCEIVC